MDTPFRFIPLVFPVVGALFVVLGIRQAVALRRFRAGARRVPGIVTDLDYLQRSTHDGTSSGGVYYPVLSFRTLDGRQVDTRAMYGRRPAPARPGDRVEVLYDPADPLRASLPGGGAALISTVFILMGALFIPLGLGLYAAFAAFPSP